MPHFKASAHRRYQTSPVASAAIEAKKQLMNHE
jgi:hypothetical protein